MKKQMTIPMVSMMNNQRVEELSHNRISLPLRAISWAEKWFLQNVYGIDPASERIVRFYTYNDEEGTDFEFEVPSYKFDLTNCLYDSFVEVATEIGKALMEQFGVVGRYFYDVKVSLSYQKEDQKYVKNFWYEVLKTDNPRCVYGNPTHRKDCDYLNSPYKSKVTISGYTLSGNYKRLVDVLGDLATKTIIVHSKADAKAVLRIARFLGVDIISKGGAYYKNNPDKRALFSKRTFGYALGRENNQTIMYIVHKSQMPINPNDLLDIDELIVKRSLRARIMDM